MTDTLVGGYFSQNYLRASSPSSDSERMRYRVAVYLNDYFHSEDYLVGKEIEMELGFKVLSRGTSSAYINWERVLKEAQIGDFFDMVTLIIKNWPNKRKYKDRITVVYDFTDFFRKVLRDQNVAYRLDDSGGVHPFVDVAFTANFSELIRNLSQENLKIAASYVARSELALLSNRYDGRLAVRSIFDAVEHIFKLICPSCNQLNNANIREHLRPTVLGLTSKEVIEKRATGKLIDSFNDWVEAGHNYRHADGAVEGTGPSIDFSVLYISQGMSFARWLAEVFLRKVD